MSYSTYLQKKENKTKKEGMRCFATILIMYPLMVIFLNILNPITWSSRLGCLYLGFSVRNKYSITKTSAANNDSQYGKHVNLGGKGPFKKKKKCKMLGNQRKQIGNSLRFDIAQP